MAAAKEQMTCRMEGVAYHAMAPIDISATLQTGQQVPHLDRLVR